MFSHCRYADVVLLITLALVALDGCEREKREYTSAPKIEAGQRLSPLRPGETAPSDSGSRGEHYENVAYHISQGGTLYRQFNCAGCHANGGGGMGPALMDEKWRYGGTIDAIQATILEGRPNGMPSFRNRVTDTHAWQLAAYVRALSGNVRKDAVPSRREGLAATPPLTQLPQQTPHGSDTATVSSPQP
jgi:cytochrome c oxidase cbb3-type subunit III